MKPYKIAVDENILIKGELCTAGSKMLYNFKSPYSATVVEKIKQAGMTVSYRSKTEEFGGAAKEESAAYAVKNGLADAALGIDVDGSAYKSAVENGVVYINPTYGTVSRFGVVANVSSVDRIGVYAKSFEDGFAVLSAISGYDKNDGTSYPIEKYEYTTDTDEINLELPKIAKIFDVEIPYAYENISINYFEFLKYIAQVYLIISAAEFSNNISRFDGLKFGYRTTNFKNVNDIVINSRSENFTVETKIKSLMGTYVLSEGQFEKYYFKAAQIRRKIKQEIDEIFKQVDFIMLPVSNSSGNTPKEYYNRLKFSAWANLTGCPSITYSDLDGGIQIIAKEFDENKLFALGKALKEKGEIEDAV